jgi:hypothetical protein
MMNSVTDPTGTVSIGAVKLGGLVQIHYEWGQAPNESAFEVLSVVVNNGMLNLLRGLRRIHKIPIEFNVCGNRRQGVIFQSWESPVSNISVVDGAAVATTLVSFSVITRGTA